VFELARDDHPRLYDDLIRFPKGTKRINRLRVLAYDGLLIEAGLIVSVVRRSPEGGAWRDDEASAAELTNDMFGAPIADEH
jgi:hypothetical protein